MRRRTPRSLERSSYLVRAAPLLVALGALSILERVWPRRPRTDPGPRRVAQNLVFAGLGGAANLALNQLLVEPVAEASVRRRFGLLQWVRLPHAVETALGVAWLDYTLYWWHHLSHRVGWMWRMHAIHHADRDLDVTTGLRFHFIELAASIPWRALHVAAFGVSPRAFDIWQSAIVVSSLFHHANLRLPPRLERLLSKFVVTPHLHEIHHSVVAHERSSNFSSGIALWDRLHGTLHEDVPTASITIGLPEPQGDAVSLRSMLLHPLTYPAPASG